MCSNCVLVLLRQGAAIPLFHLSVPLGLHFPPKLALHTDRRYQPAERYAVSHKAHD